MARLILLIIFLMVMGCKSSDTYSNLYTRRLYKDGNFIDFYLLQSSAATPSKDLLICINGSAKESVLGKKVGKSWETVSLPFFIRKSIGSSVDILIPEHPNMEAGKLYANDLKTLSSDHFEIKTKAYATIFDFILTQSTYKRVFLLGYSEGGYMLPRILLMLKYPEKINGLILCSSGGLSYAEILAIQRQSNALFSEKYRLALNQLDAVIQEIKHSKDKKQSDQKFFLGWPLAKWRSYLFYRPIDDLRKLSIPILVLHGENDLNIPVESSRYIEDVFKKDKRGNLSYIEYKQSNHTYNGQWEHLIQDIQHWISDQKL